MSNNLLQSESSRHILICSGEASGDMHGAALLASLQQQHPDWHYSAVAGEAMRRQGCECIVPMESLNVMGLGDVLKALPRIFRVAATISDWAEQQRPDLVVLIDFPGFHMRLGKRLRRLGIPVLYYIAPKLWAWGSWRVRRLLQAQDRLASILPFEEQWFASHGIQSTYVGNPSAQACAGGWSRSELCQRYDLNSQYPVLALLPGSRKSELIRHAALLAEVVGYVREHLPNVQMITTQAPGVSKAQLAPLIAEGVTVIERLQDGYALRVDAAVAVSGTATLELALWNTPTILVYRNTPTMIWLARKLVGTQCAGLANIILDDQPVMPEFIQEQATLAHIGPYLLRLLASTEAALQQRQQFAVLRQRLGKQNPTDGLCKLIHEMLNKQ